MCVPPQLVTVNNRGGDPRGRILPTKTFKKRSGKEGWPAESKVSRRNFHVEFPKRAREVGVNRRPRKLANLKGLAIPKLRFAADKRGGGGWRRDNGFAGATKADSGEFLIPRWNFDENQRDWNGARRSSKHRNRVSVAKGKRLSRRWLYQTTSDSALPRRVI